MLNFLRITVVLVLLATSVRAGDRSHARSMVITRYGIVATSHVQASAAGAQILAKGGSAVDAAIAANAVLGVTEPMMNGMGGDLFAIYWDAKTGKLYGINSSGWAPQGLTVEHLKSKGATTMPETGIDTVTVPGAVAGWNALHGRFGKLAWKEIFQPAIFYAERGYPVPELIQGFWEESVPTISPDPESRRVFLPGGKPPALGQIFQNPDLAKALGLIARPGRHRLLQRRNRAGHSQHRAGTRRNDGGGRSGRVHARVGRPDLNHLPGLDRIRVASQRAGHGRA